jgi:hypothetical protein
MGKFVVKISQEGFDVKTCEDKDLILSSDLNQLKNAIIGSGGAGTVAHGLSYIPMFFTSRQSGGNGSIIGDDPNVSCDATNLTIGASTKYYIFYQEGS